jgi:DNA-binding transcriptional ArsR family regulator
MIVSRPARRYDRRMVTTAAIAEIGALLGDPARATMMVALLDGRALTARELADRAGIAPQTASSHLHKLAGAGMIAIARQGRHRYHRLASPGVARLLEQMHVAGSALAATAPRGSGPRDPAMREARSCYDHLAGRIAVEMADILLDVAGDPEDTATVSPRGIQALQAMGIDLARIAASKRSLCRACLDWSERRPHVAGAVGAALLDTMLERGWVHRRPGTRALSVSAQGERGLHQVFGIRAVRS